MERPVGPAVGPLPTEPLHEAPIGIAAIQTLATAGEDADRVAILVSGLPEAQGVRADDGSTELAITLLRSVGWLSRADLTTRTASAGPMMCATGPAATQDRVPPSPSRGGVRARSATR